MMDCGRRDFVVRVAGALVAALPGCAAVAVTRVSAPDGMIRLSLREHPRLTQPGGYLKLQPDALPFPVYVLAVDEGYAAVSPVCKHLGCIVNIEGPRLVCPCHGSMYDRQGFVLRGPTTQALDVFPTTLTREGELMIRVGG
ncbi:MAG: ubiquinol-cytochrome c reductase iron-sulfur subunit [Longimicrobiales bacterium]